MKGFVADWVDIDWIFEIKQLEKGKTGEEEGVERADFLPNALTPLLQIVD